ncbi:hypothetical protein, partial [Rhizobium leguminosarum]|uniref:hypothetical protein n=1 Tax=Rhizobium leguminosarum TaxID=384 RepID=UPI003F9AB0C5
DAVRTSARSYGLTKLFDSMAALGFRASMIKKSLRTKIEEDGLLPTSPAAVVNPAQRAAAPTLNTAAILSMLE